MKIVTWNCNGAFRKKFLLLNEWDADVLVIQECENPALSLAEYREWAGDSYLWVGENKNRGVGIFSRNKKITVNQLPWFGKHQIKVKGLLSEWCTTDLQFFLPCSINNSFVLLGVWTKRSKTDALDYIGQLWKYLQIHHPQLFTSSTIICGDLNAHVMWDKASRYWNLSDVVSELNNIGLKSLYHSYFNEKYGEETCNTLFMQRKVDRPFHIDYVYLSEQLIGKTTLLLGFKEYWLQYSDHIPLIFEIKRDRDCL